MHHEPGGQALFARSASLIYRSSPKLLRWRLALFRPAWLLRWSLQWRQLWPLLDADADRVDLESRLIKLLLEDRARVSVCWQGRSCEGFADAGPVVERRTPGPAYANLQ